MTRLRKVLSLALVLGLLASLLMTGCTEKETADQEGKTTKETTKETEATEEELKPAALKVLFTSAGKQQDSDKVWAEFNKKLPEYLPNTTVEFEVVSPGEYQEKWQLAIAAGEEMDIAWTGWMIPYVQEVMKGAYKPLDDLIDQYAPGIREELPSWVLDKARVDGKIYSIPCYGQMTASRITIKLQKELADKYLDVDEALKVFNSSKYMTKEKYDVIGNYLKTLKDNGELRKGISPHIYFDIYNTGFEKVAELVYIDVHGKEPLKVISKYDIPDTKLMMDTYHDWFNKGYVRQDVIGMELSDIRKDEGKLDGYVIWESGLGFEQDNADTLKFGYDVINVPVFDYFYLPNSQSGSSLTIAKTSQNPERAMMLMELLYTKKGSEIYNLLAWGLEGEHYNKVAEGRIETIDYATQAKADSKYGLWWWAVGNTFNSWSTQAQPEGYLEFMVEANENAIASPIMGFKVDTEPIKNELAQTIAVREEYKNMWWLPDFEDRYKEMVEKIKKAGIDKMVEEVQRQIDEWAKANGKK